MGKGKGKKSKGNTPKVMSPEPRTPKVQSPEPKTPKVMSPEPAEKEKGQLDAAMPKSERKEAIIKGMEQMEKEQVKREKEKMTEEEVEGKCKTVKSDMADMAMTEQYLRTKQALLMAKKKEQEMKVAANIAAIREQEVQKMRDKVKCMQDLLASRKAKLKITEEI